VENGPEAFVEESPVTQPSRGVTLAVTCVAAFMLILDMSIIPVALADIQRQLGGDLASLQWVIDAYTLSLAGLLLTAATLGDRIGRRRIFLMGLVVFTLASAGCAIAWSPVSLDLIRAVQGIGASLLFGTATPLVAAAFTDAAARARAIGVLSAVLTAASAAAPLIGGLLVNGPGWRWIFLVNLPLAVLALLLSPRIVESRSSSPRTTDWPGVLLLTSWLLAGLLALIRGSTDGWGSLRILSLLATAAILLAGFVIRELTARQPMLDLKLFTMPRFSGLSIGAFTSAATFTAATTYITLYLMNGLGHSPLQAGLCLLPMTLPAFATAPLTASVMTRLPLWSLAGGSVALCGTGLVLAAFVKDTSDWTALVPGLVIGGIGIGMSGPVIPAGTLTTVEPDRSGMATGTINTLRHAGVAVGVASLGAIFQHIATSRSTNLLATTPLPEKVRSRLAEAVGTGAGTGIADAVPPPLRTAVATAGRTASAESLSRILLVAGLVALAGTLLSTPLIARQPRLTQLPRQATHTPQPSPREELHPATRGGLYPATRGGLYPATAAPPYRITPPQPDPGTPPRPAPSPRRQARLADQAAAPRSWPIAQPGPPEADRWTARHGFPPKNGRAELRRQQELADVVCDLRRSLPELHGVMIASTDGLPIVHDFSHGMAQQVAAVAATTVNVGRRMPERTQYGRLSEAVIKGDSGCLFVFSVDDDGILVMAGPVNPDIDMIRIEAQAASETISRVLARR
jgi:EmrB/QacA subfamily drug resistance transporter